MTKTKKLFTKDREFYQLLLSLALPIALQNLVNFSVAMADTVMVSRLGVSALAGANLANKFSTIFTLFTFGLGGGANVIIAQYWGKQDAKSIREVVTIMYRALFVGSLLFSAIAIFFPMQAMSIFSKDTATIAAGAEYLRIIGFSYFFAGFASATTTLWRSVGSASIALVVYLCSLGTNIFLNWVFIFGNLGAPALGMTGAAIGTLSARIVEVIIVLIYMVKFEHKINYRPSDLFRSAKGQSQNFVRIARPVVINEIIWGLGSTVIGVIIGRMGEDVAAAEAVTSVLSQLVTIFIWGVGHSSAAIIGNTIGKGEHEKAQEYSKTLMTIGILLGLFSMGIVLLIRTPMINLFKLDRAIAVEYAYQMVGVYSIIVFFQAISAVGLIGILRGAGNSKFVLVMDLIFLWAISIPLGFIAGLKIGLPIAIVYGIIRSDEIFKSGAALWRLAKGGWVQDVTVASFEGPDPIEL